MRKHLSFVPLAIVVLACSVAAQPANPRIGKWKLKQDAPPPALNSAMICFGSVPFCSS